MITNNLFRAVVTGADTKLIQVIDNNIQYQTWDIILEEDSKRFNTPLESGWGLNKSINVYELTNKCKEFAIYNNYILQTRVYAKDSYEVAILKNDDRLSFCRKFSKNTEPEAIFKACEWILEQKETK